MNVMLMYNTYNKRLHYKTLIIQNVIQMVTEW